MNFTELYKSDLARYPGKVHGYIKKYLFLFRKAQTSKQHRYINLYWRWRLRKISEKRGIEIGYTVSIGKGLYLGHAYNITINKDAVLGDNCNIHKGVTIGRENRGKREGSPTIGSNVWIGIGAIVVGRISIGDDVLIAPNSYINCDVPSHSIVIGNPCIIKPRENATQNYISNLV